MKSKPVNGFTLIELIIVIVILGVLAVTAAPRFLGIAAEARTATLNGVKAQIQGQVNIVFNKLAVAGLTGRNPANNTPVTGGGYYGNEPANNPFNNICGGDCYFIYGTPSASATTLTSIMDDIGQQEDIVFSGYHSNDWAAEGVTGTNVVGTFSFKDNVNIQANEGKNTLKQDNCFIWYSGAREDRSYKIGVVPCE